MRLFCMLILSDVIGGIKNPLHARGRARRGSGVFMPANEGGLIIQAEGKDS